MNIFKAIIKYVETLIKDIYVSFNPNVVRLKTLAEKYNIDSNFHEIEIGCPSVVNPLNQTETIKHEWANEKFTNISKVDDKTDKGFRYFEALNALEAIDHMLNYRTDEGEKLFTELGIFGRVMFVYIASRQDEATAKNLIEIIKPWADKGLYMTDNDFIKAEGITVKHLFDKYIKPVLDEYDVNNGEGSRSGSNLNNGEADEKSDSETEEKELSSKAKALNDHQKELLDNAVKQLKLSEEIVKEIDDLKNKCIIDNKFKQSVAELVISDDQTESQEVFNGGMIKLIEDYSS